jgi:hypothetical protein
MRLLLAFCVSFIVLTAPSSAGQLSASGGVYTYEADQGGNTESDQLDIRMEATSIVFEDLTLTPATGFGANCASESTHRLRCPAAGITKVVVHDHATLSNTATRFTAQATFPLPVEMTSNATPSSVASVQLTGGAGDDKLSSCQLCAVVIAGNGGNDQLTGGIADDELSPGAGGDAVVGGDGTDTVRYDDAFRTTGVTVNLQGSGDQGSAEDGPAGARDAIIGVEAVTGTNFADTISGCQELPRRVRRSRRQRRTERHRRHQRPAPRRFGQRHPVGQGQGRRPARR